jgi:hypothetical protein
MAIQAYVHDLACDMLSVDELPLDLRNYLDEVEMYANLAGGFIQSRQMRTSLFLSGPKMRQRSL